MHAGTLPANPIEAISAAAATCHQRQHLAEPLWFAVMCRELWGANAAKELQFILTKVDPERTWSDRTCRAWASGDCEPGASVLALLITSDHGLRIVAWVVRISTVAWWSNVQRAIRIAAQIDKLELE